MRQEMYRKTCLKLLGLISNFFVRFYTMVMLSIYIIIDITIVFPGNEAILQ